MDSSSSTNTGNFAKQAATASLIAPGIAIVMGLLVKGIHESQTSMVVIGVTNTLLIFGGFILGIIGLRMKQSDDEGVLWRSIVGITVNGFFALSILIVFSKIITQQAADAAAARINNDYDQNDVQFSYDGTWGVTVQPGAENGNHATEQVIIERHDHGAAICISMYPAGSQLLNLESFGRAIIQQTGGTADPQTVSIKDNIGGINQPGLRFHFSSLRSGGVTFTGDGDFYRLQTPQHEVMVDSLTRGNPKVIASMKKILASLKIDGGNNVVSVDEATAATAMASRTATPAPKVEGFFIPAANRADMVHDLKRNILYITCGDSVLRYQLESKNFLEPLKLGGDLRGIDISPDNEHLAVADADGGNGHVRIHVVDLASGMDNETDFNAERQESGTYSVAYGADGQIWISSSMSGSGWLPLRKYNPPTRSVLRMPQVSPDTMLAASADRQSIGFAEARSSPGTYGRILYRASQLPPQSMQSDEYLYEVAISRDGAQLAAPGYNSMALAGAPKSELKEREIVGAAYHPQRNYLFVSQRGHRRFRCMTRRIIRR